jgi:undecaprenyl-diphosphatase
VVILSVIQGLTEWLPISSSGHLVFFQQVFGIEVPLLLDVMLHFGTLIVILIVFRKKILKIIKALIHLEFKSEEGKLGIFLIVGSIPIAIIGAILFDIIESFFSNLLVVGIALILSGCIIFFSEKRLGKKKITLLDSFLIGIAQSIALIPGISRSGITISVGLLGRIDRHKVFNYSFLLAIPAILGATIFESKELILGTIDPILLSLGIITSTVIGYGSLKFLNKIIIMKKFHLFAYYCWLFGILVIFFVFIQ